MNCDNFKGKALSATLERPMRPEGYLKGLRPAQIAALLAAYYAACTAYNNACVADVASAVDLSVSDGSELSGEPLSDVSVHSSASSGRARRRARWRAKQKARVKSMAVSQVSYTTSTVSVSVEQKASDCYLRMVKPECQVSVGQMLGSAPDFESVLSVPRDQIVDDLSLLFVSRVNDGMFHLGKTGVSAQACFSAVVVKAVTNCAYEPPVGSLGAFMRDNGDWARHVDKAPGLCDRLAGDVGEQRTVGGCQFCSVARDYVLHPEQWVRERQVGAVPNPDSSLVKSCLLHDGRLLGIQRADSVYRLAVYSSVRSSAMVADMDAWLACGRCGKLRAGCTCSAISVGAWLLVRQVGDVEMVPCGYGDCAYRMSTRSKLALLAKTVVKVL